MNLRDLEYFVAVAELKHFGRAAEKVFVSQPTLSMQLKKLEDYLGVDLFERTNKQVHLTVAGQALYAQAKAIMNAAKGLRETAKRYTDASQAHIKMGVIPTIAPYFLPQLLPLLRKHFPKLQLEVHELKTEEIIKNLKAHDLDVGLLALPLEEEELKSLILFEEPFLLAVAASCLPKTIKSIKDLKNQDLLLLEDGHCLRSQALEFCGKQGIKTAAKIRASNLETLRALVVSGAGYTLMPKMAACKTPGLAYVELKPSPQRQIGFLFRKTSSYLPLFEDIADKIKH